MIYPHWFLPIMLEKRAEIELIYDILDVKEMTMEQILFEAEEHRKKIERDKNLILYNYLGNRIIMRQPFKD